jgi:hypothetical protein
MSAFGIKRTSTDGGKAIWVMIHPVDELLIPDI